MKLFCYIETCLLLLFLFPVFSSYADQEPVSSRLPVARQTTNPIQLIMAYANDIPTTLRIADCESKLGKYRENWQGSSARGLLMFMPSTFNAYCKGNIDNDIDQIKCFNKLYPLHKNWWKCQ